MPYISLKVLTATVEEGCGGWNQIKVLARNLDLKQALILSSPRLRKGPCIDFAVQYVYVSTHLYALLHLLMSPSSVPTIYKWLLL